jgi:glycosyltransferase involved in cell wall biosynthesis
MIKVLGLALYGPLAASTRYRLGQYVSGLASIGIDLEICHLLGDDYLRRRFSGGFLPFNEVFHGALHRLSDLLRIRNYDLAILHCELFPLMPSCIEGVLLRVPYIYDFDDAFYLKYRNPRFGVLSPLLRNKFDNVIRRASAITAGNSVLKNYAEQFNPQTFLLPTVVDPIRYTVTKYSQTAGPFVVGWIGSPSTVPYLQSLVQPMSLLGREGPVRFIMIGGKAPEIPNVEVIEVAWNEDTEVELLNQFDVGVMPLPDDDWARGKCAFKLIQYMACGVPVVASPVGANIDVVSKDCGLLAGSSEEWLESLRWFRDNPVSRKKIGALGRERVVKHYSLGNNLPQLAAVIRQVALK